MIRAMFKTTRPPLSRAAKPAGKTATDRAEILPGVIGRLFARHRDTLDPAATTHGAPLAQAATGPDVPVIVTVELLTGGVRHVRAFVPRDTPAHDLVAAGRRAVADHAFPGGDHLTLRVAIDRSATA